MSISRLAIVFGVLLMLVTLYSVFSSANNFFTAYLPAAVGVLLVLLGGLCEGRDTIRRPAMQAAALITALAAVGSIYSLVTQSGAGANAQIAQVATLVLSVLFAGIVVMRTRSA